MNLYQAQYVIVRYIPDLLKNEPINIGLIFQCTAERYLKTKFSSKKISRIHRYNNDINMKVINSIIEDLEMNFNDDNWINRNKPWEDFKDSTILSKLNYFHANQIQFTKPKGLITENLDNEFNILFECLIYKDNREVLSRGVQNKTIHKRFKNEFDRRGLLDNKLVLENFEQTGKFGEKIIYDFSYVNGMRNLINNVSFDITSKEPMDIAKVLLSNYSGVKEEQKKQNIDVDIKIVYYIPNKDDSKVNANQILDCLREGSDELINFEDNERIEYFIKHVEETAHK